MVGEWSAAPENRIEFQRLDAEVNSLLQTLQPPVSVGSRPRNESIDKLQNWIVTWLINKLNIPPDSVNFSKSFADYGVDSVMAVELAEDLKVKLKLPQSLEPTLAWNFPTIEALSEYLVSLETATYQENARQESTLEKDLTNKAIKSDEPIAIIGLGCRFPGGANSPEAYWQNLRDGVDAIAPIPPTRWDIDTYYDRDSDIPGKMYARAGGFIDDVDKFDPYFFEISPREAIGTDPQHRLLLEVSYSALENAGLAPESLKGSRTGVFVGISFDDYSRLTLNSGDSTRIDAHSSLGNTRSIAAGRLSYALDLQGPSLQLDTACSSSLLTVHLACQSLRSGECNVALAGGVNLILSPETTISLCKLKALSVQGACKTFDASADGYVRGEGCGIVVLKRLEDAIASNDNILAVIRGSAVNHDGRSNGLTAPNGSAQESLIRQALINANVKSRDIQYVEAHGTGTALGDPIEVLALDKVLGEGRTSETPLIIGSVKTNIGHLESAAGIASLIKVVLSLQHERIPPHLHLTNPNPYIPWGKLSIKVPQTLTPWQDAEGFRLAGVSSFGMSGTNVHLIVENAPKKQVRQTSVERPVRILTLSAKTESALQSVASNYTTFLSEHPDLSMADVCFTSNVGRSHFNHRAAFIFASKTELDRQLEAFTSEKEIPGLLKGKTINKRSKLAFLFTGQGSQYTGMGRQLYETSPTFRNTLDRCTEILQSYLETPLLEVLYPKNPESSAAKLLHETAYTQPALFALEYSLYQLWKSWGIEPDIVMGHSVGEYVAACVAGVFSLEDGLRLIAERGRLMQSLPDNGEMVSVLASAKRVSVAIKPYERDVAIAAINGPQSTVISGEKQRIKAIRTSLEAEGLKTKQLPVSHAFHSPLVTPILKDFERIAAGIKYLSPQIDIISNVTGKLVSKEIARPEYWVRHIQQPVRFSTSMETLAQQGSELFVEMGPNPLLLGMGRQCIDTGNWLPSLRNGRSD